MIPDALIYYFGPTFITHISRKKEKEEKKGERKNKEGKEEPAGLSHRCCCQHGPWQHQGTSWVWPTQWAATGPEEVVGQGSWVTRIWAPWVPEQRQPPRAGGVHQYPALHKMGSKVGCSEACVGQGTGLPLPPFFFFFLLFFFFRLPVWGKQ